MHLRLELAMCEPPTAVDALRAVLLFHGGGPWTRERADEWERITGEELATTKTLCDTVRAALAALNPEENIDGVTS